MTSWRAALCGLSLLAALPARAADGDWQTVATGAITVKSRIRPGSSVKELWAEGAIDAPVQDIQSALMDPEAMPKFMPYVKEGRFVGPPREDGSRIVYTRLDLPVVAPRDYVLKVNLDQGTAPDGSGEFKNRWVATNDLPERANIVRLHVNEGSWHVTALANGKSWAVYKFNVDPGGWIPTFAADMGNKSGVADTYKAVEKEARRRAAARMADAGR
jgi:hypothetical protein